MGEGEEKSIKFRELLSDRRGRRKKPVVIVGDLRKMKLVCVVNNIVRILKNGSKKIKSNN